ncbi:MAG: glycine--tRNA ligase subunit beta [Desulfobacteraceae bacterium]|nr:glycine--tRNA ligase subunit beta [Desulfobacteraceae bacterium]
MNPLLIEIGTEELPSGYIAPALEAFKSRLIARLRELRIECGQAFVYGTPRRLAVLVQDVADRQRSATTQITGPPERVAFDEQGNTTVAARKFAEKSGVSVNKLQVKDTEKGRYVCVQKTEQGRSAAAVLRRVLPELISSIPFPKTMRWGELRVAFARPVHSITALLGERSVSFTFGDIRSGRRTFGHRFMKPGRIRLDSADQYLDVLADAYVLADMDQRRSVMYESLQQTVKKIKGHILEDPELVETNNNLVEYPAVVLGDFDEKFLELPREVLVTAMREHQRYFAVVDDKNGIMPYFVSVNNTRARNMEVVAKGHERVLKARLEDARFFYHQDLKVRLDERVESLKSVVFQAELGSVYDKTARIRQLGQRLSGMLGIESRQRTHIDRAALLCKTDLVSHVVNEFPKLQGVMGRVYAKVKGEPGEVAEAIEAHYRPAYSGGPLPETTIGAVLSIADKIDTICGCYCAGLVPTGASDPYALRRQGIGIILTALGKGLEFSLSEIISACLEMFSLKGEELDKKAQDVLRFLENRMEYLLEDSGIPKDLALAAISASSDRIPDVWRRARALHSLKSAPDFESLAVAFKRVVNIIRKADPEDVKDTTVNAYRFSEPAEKALYNSFLQARERVAADLAEGGIDDAFSEIAALKPEVDAFFDTVLVMSEDPVIRKNRLALLKQISDLFARLADFSRIST